MGKSQNELIKQLADLNKINAELKEEQKKYIDIKEKLHRQNMYLNSLHETALSLMNRLNTEDLLEDIVKRACSLTGTPHGFIYLIDPDFKKMQVMLGLGIYQRYIGSYREKGKALSGVIWETGQSLAVEDYHSWEKRSSQNERPYGWDVIQSLMGAPLKSDSEVTGVIGLGFENKRTFCQDDIDMLNRFAGLASIALDNARLYSALQEELIERKQYEEKLQYISLHDCLTGFFNRTHFESEIRRLEKEHLKSVGIIICDVDGLKLANDSFGHDMGDALLQAAAGVIKKAVRKEDFVARIGGDEFAIVLPECDNLSAEKVCHRIQAIIDEYNSATPPLALSMSIGLALGDNNQVISELFKEADNNMYREKLHRKQSARNIMVQTLMNALKARDYIAEGHAERLEGLTARLAEVLGLTSHQVSDIRLLARFHDIGKVGIPDGILFKPGPLTSKQTKEMQRHCQIGFSIAQSSPDLAPIADWILKHHEWWNGMGYPLGLKGGEIPLACRILSIADAFDSMINDRPYRKAMTLKEAVAELKRGAGTQFDPELVNKFIALLGQPTAEE